ncbi:MAG: metal ABC transporter substrate-binding protein [Eubacteriales bacterium]|jgi:zinc transport system substrate-binding protein|nr:metal ABC transporter substrate-binding protein [Eubacteriales bacterium]MDD4710908.1 metal ABC transporter substrate-binding protein [Eubacteriales bacterium]NLO15361.1 zinc ABC transporter substrate-binding protein [Clostridiales bacterium]
MKKTIILLLALLLLAPFALTNAEQGTLNIVCTTFPILDWTRHILGDRAEKVNLTLLQASGADVHSYQPTARDFINVSGADLLIYFGGYSDSWVPDAVATARNRDIVALNLMDVMGDRVKADTLVTGMQHGHDEDHDSHEPEHEPEDEHIWLSLRAAKVLTQAIADTLSRLDNGNAAAYQDNAADYHAALAALDQEYAQAVADAPCKTLLFGDRFPFRYLLDDYGISYFAAFSGCSSESEASFETVAFLSRQMDELDLKNIITIDGSDGRIAGAVLKASKDPDRPLFTLDAMQSVNMKDIESGANYLDIMRQNLAVLINALQ